MKSPVDFETLIVGTGFSGLGMAVRLKQEGRHSFVVLEKADEVGGTWRENHYPGCACDVPSHLYSFSFEKNPYWSRMFAPQQEILDYLKQCADKYGVRPHIRFNTEVTRAEFDEAHGIWNVWTNKGKAPIRARYLVLGVGALSRPAYPDIKGIENFRGRVFHSAEWEHDYDFAGKRVAVVGTGASAIQFVPQLAPQVSRLDLYQRTAPWVLPKPDFAIAPAARKLFKALPPAEKAFRYFIYWWMEGRGFGFTVNPNVMKLAAAMGRRHIASQIDDPILRKAVTPDYTPGCKRILMANDYYSTLNRPNVDVVTDGIREVTADAVVTRDGTKRKVDAIVYGTGFRVTELLTPLEIRGIDGVDINDAWKNGIEAYRGTSVSGFPNAFILMGPNTGLGHNSMVFMIESQINYTLRYMEMLEKHGKTWADVKPDAQSAYNAKLQPRLQRSVWASGCQSWYLDERGRNATNWPGFTFEFWYQMRKVRESDYRLFSGDRVAV